MTQYVTILIPALTDLCMSSADHRPVEQNPTCSEIVSTLFSSTVEMLCTSLQYFIIPHFLSLPHSPVKRATAKGRWVVDGSKLGKMWGKNYPDAFGEGALWDWRNNTFCFTGCWTCINSMNYWPLKTKYSQSEWVFKHNLFYALIKSIYC